MSLEELDELEKKWKGPEAQKAFGGANDTAQNWEPIDWEPIDGLTPYSDKWTAVVDGRDLNQRETQPELSAACIDAIKKLWEGADFAKHVLGDHINCGNPEHLFHCYPISLRGRGAAVWEDWIRRGGDPAFWWCSSLQQAGEHYCWPPHSAGTFEQLATALQCAMRMQDEVKTNVVCRKILDWGGVRDRKNAARLDWFNDQTQRGNLISSIRAAAGALRASSMSNLDALFSENGIPMTSGTTKIFAAAALDFSLGWSTPTQDVLIFDGRVTGALGLVARRVSHTLPKAFRFPSSRESNRRRDPSCAHITFPNLHSLSNVERARFARLGAHCIERIVGKSKFLLAEKALFMIGYDVRHRCGKQNRSCP